MIVVNSSAVLAVLFDEPERVVFQGVIDGPDHCVMSAVNVRETACVLRGKHGPTAVAQFWQWLADSGIEVRAFDEAQARAAAAAFDRYGKGNRVSKARLNLADCAAYALANADGSRLLFKGDDFSRTDIDPAVVQRS